MKKLVLLSLLVASNFAFADSLVRSKVYTYKQYSLEDVNDYDLQKVKDANKKAEDEAVTKAVNDLQCAQFQHLDITGTTITPNKWGDGKSTIELVGVCQDSKMRNF